MKKKVLVTYSVKYIKEVELEVTEAQNKWLERGIINSNISLFNPIIEFNEEILFDLPIPTICVTEIPLENIEVEYVEDSFEIESFEL